MSSSRSRLLLKPESTAFFVCDIQERFRGLIWNFPHVINTAAKMLDAAELLKVPVIVTEQHPKALGNTVKELNIQNARVVVAKTKFSMFVPQVEKLLKEELKTENAVIFGIESHVCVMQTALELLDHNYNVIVLADGVSSQNKGEVSIALARLRAAGATVATSESIMFQLLGDASHEKFRDLSKLVKKHSGETKAAHEAITANL
ncbi:Isochorismatase-like protein [Fimicolochytrium jonesii]|uniref:Isochorismatase-like protein n=1 Tax=Fimicolochytrium jonesii TaxID=1396493 RepID=UPI0022FF1F97|nr:Isochorismatase-like protein [Fimicolochytrium jonesii]KAI8819904.1 Isochorismatase-like protein [Fimicolochytrium jonesii]